MVNLRYDIFDIPYDVIWLDIDVILMWLINIGNERI